MRSIPSADSSLSPLELWCNEAQERYVLAIAEQDIERFRAICERERCPFAVVGTATRELLLQLTDANDASLPVDLPLSVLFGKPPRMQREFQRTKTDLPALDLAGIDLAEALHRVLRLPAVASKSFLITIGDRLSLIHI